MISKEKLIELYTAMVKCRMITEHALAGRSEESTETSLGREAILAGVCGDLLPVDTLDCLAADMAASYLLGASLDGLLSSYSTNGQGGATAKGSGPHRLRAVCDAAESHKQAKDGKVAVAFCMEGESGPAQWQDALSRANKLTLPVIYVCSHSIQTVLLPAMSAKNKNPRALAFGVPVISVDGSDVRAVYRVASESIARARQRRGPTVIECLFAGFPKRESAQSANGRHEATEDCLASMERYLVAKRLIKASSKREIADRFSQELRAASQTTIH